MHARTCTHAHTHMHREINVHNSLIHEESCIDEAAVTTAILMRHIAAVTVASTKFCRKYTYLFFVTQQLHIWSKCHPKMEAQLAQGVKLCTEVGSAAMLHCDVAQQ